MYKNRWLIGDPLYQDMLSMLWEGKHLALIGPRNGGKTLALQQLTDIAYAGAPKKSLKIAHINGSDYRQHSDVPSLLHQLKADLGSPDTCLPDLENGEPLAISIRRLLETTNERHPTLWVFIGNILGFPKIFARDLLHALAHIHHENRKKLGSVVCGSQGFVHLTYGNTSPFRHAKKYIISGLDEQTSIRYFVDHRIRLLGRDSALLKELITDNGFRELYRISGGDPSLMEELIISSGRCDSSIRQRLRPLPTLWSESEVTFLKKLYLHRALGSEPGILNTIWEAKIDPDIIVKLLGVDLSTEFELKSPASGEPHSLELIGVIRRQGSGRYSISNGVWKDILNPNIGAFSTRFLADANAVNRRWKEAWIKYRESEANIGVMRPVFGGSVTRFDQVIQQWQESFWDHIGSTRTLLTHFFNGAKLLYGFSSGGVYCKRKGSPIPMTAGVGTNQAEIPVSGCVQGGWVQYPSSNRYMENDSFTEDPTIAFGDLTCSDSGKVLRSEHEKSLNWPTTSPVLFLKRDHLEVDSDEYQTLGRVIREFWTAYHRAMKLDYDKHIGDIRKRHLSIIKEVNKLLSVEDFSMKNFVDRTAYHIVGSGGYFRSQIALVDPEWKAIQSVASACEIEGGAVDFCTNESLEVQTAQNFLKEQDVQVWVVLKREKVVIPDASRPSPPEPVLPRTKIQECKKLGMQTIIVVPMMIGERVIGTLHFERRDKGHPPEAEEALFEILASQLAVVFDRAQKLTLLQESLAVMRTQVSIIESGNRLLYVNDSALSKAYQGKLTNSGWQKTAVKYEGYADRFASGPARERQRESTKNLLSSIADEPVQFYYIDHSGDTGSEKPEGQRAFDWMVSPVFDFRNSLDPPFHNANGRIGSIERVYDLSEFYNLAQAFRDWLDAKKVETAGRAILAYFRSLGFGWGRLFLVEKSKEVLRSYDEFGLSEEGHKNFVNGEVVYRKDQAEGTNAWHVLNSQSTLAIYGVDAKNGTDSYKQFKTPAGWPHGIPCYVKSKLTRKDTIELEKSETGDQFWIEIALKAGEVPVGKLVLSRPPDLNWLGYSIELIRYAAMGAGAAISSALNIRRDTEKENESAIRRSAQMAIHQLRNKIGPSTAYIDLAQDSIERLPSDPANAGDNLKKARDYSKKALDILDAFRSFASNKPFSNFEYLTPLELKEIICSKAEAVIANEGKIISPDDVNPELKIGVNRKYLDELVEVLVSNSMIHSDRKRGELTVTVLFRVRWSLEKNSNVFETRFIDNGKGISKDLREKVFEAFNSFAVDGTGSGLGLAIARNIAERMYGSIEICPDREDSTGKGACFIFTLPGTKVANDD